MFWKKNIPKILLLPKRSIHVREKTNSQVVFKLVHTGFSGAFFPVGDKKERRKKSPAHIDRQGSSTMEILS